MAKTDKAILSAVFEWNDHSHSILLGNETLELSFSAEGNLEAVAIMAEGTAPRVFKTTIIDERI